MKSISLRSLILFGIATIQVLGAAGFLVAFFLFANRAADDHARSNLHWALSSVRQEVLNFFENAELTVNSAIRLSGTELLETASPPTLTRYFYETLEANPQLTGMFHATGRGDFVFVTRESAFLDEGQYFSRIIRQSGDARAASDAVLGADMIRNPAPDSDASGYRPQERPWFAGAMAGADAAWTAPYKFFASRQPGITIARRVPGTAAEGAEIFGIDLSLLGISRFIEGLSLSPGGKVFVADLDGNVIAAPGYERSLEPARDDIVHYSEYPDPIVRAALANAGMRGEADLEDGSGEYVFEHGQERYFTVFQPIRVGQASWIIGATAPSGDFIGWFSDVRTTTLVLILILTGLSMFAGWALWRRVNRSLETIQYRSRKLLGQNPEAFNAAPSHIRELAETETALAVMASHVEERDRQNRQITERLAEIVMAVDHAPVGIAIFEPAGDVTYMNPLVNQFLMLPGSAQSSGQSLPGARLVGAVDSMPAYSCSEHKPVRKLAEAIASGESAWEGQMEPAGASSDQPAYFAIAAPIHRTGSCANNASGSSPWFLVIEDATSRVQAERALVDALESAEEASSAKSRFLAGMSHELRTPLNSIIGFSDLLLNDRLRPQSLERQRDYIETIRHSGRILLDILTNILDMTAIETGRFTLNYSEGTLADIVASAVEGEDSACEAANVSVNTDIPNDCTICADTFKLERVITNLLRNSAKYAGAGSQVTITGICDDAHVRLVVEDNGVGISETDLESATLPFHRSERDETIAVSDGVGLGLSIAQSIVNLHGGTMALSAANSGQGLRVSISLPRNPEPSEVG